MSNVAGAQAPTKRFAHQTLGVEDLRENVEDLGKSVGDMATRQPAVSERLLGSASGGSLSVVHFVSNSGMGRDGFHIDRAGAFDVGVLRFRSQAPARAPRYGNPDRAPHRHAPFIERERFPFAFALTFISF